MRPAFPHAVGERWFGDETYVKVDGAWWYVYRAVDQQAEVIADRALALANVIKQRTPAALNNAGRRKNDLCKAAHGGFKALLRPILG